VAERTSAAIPRILYMSPHGFLGGAERSLLVLLEALDRARYRPAVLTFEDGPLTERLRAAGIPTDVIPLPPALSRATHRYRGYPARTLLGVSMAAAPVLRRLRRAIHAIQPALIHTNGMRAHLLGGLAGRLAGVPVIWHLRDFLHEGAAGRIVRALARLIPARVIVNSDAVGASLGLTRHVRRVYNGVDLRTFSPDRDGSAFRRAQGFGAEAPLVALVAHLTPWKGHLVFLDACRLIAARRADCRFALVGGPVYGTDGHAGYAESVAEAVRAHGLEDRVALAGVQDDTPTVMAALDILVHASTASEPFGRTLIEAMASARPVVATRGGGTAEVILEGETGLLVPPGAPDALAEAVLRLLDDPALRHRLGRAGRRRAEKQFGAEAHAAEVMGIYADVLGDNR